jgi:hypothetical protein
VCDTDFTECGDECVDLLTDVEHCGECDNLCPVGGDCVEGDCVCPDGEEDCGGVCTDTQITYEHCGECDHSCVNNQICVEGACDCDTGLSDCSDVCVDLTTDDDHCGDCDIVCRSDQFCADSSCTCADGLTDCGTECADVGWDDDHCTGCNLPCPSGETCTDGECLSSPCDGLGCSTVVQLSETAEGFRADNIGTTARCFEAWDYAPTETNARIVCWNFAGGRTMRVNGMDAQCITGEGFALGGPRGGGYCVEISAGDNADAGFILPNR